MELCSELVAYWQPGKILSGSGLGTLAVVIEPDSAAGAGHVIGKHPRRGGHPVLKQTGTGSDNHGSQVDTEPVNFVGFQQCLDDALAGQNHDVATILLTKSANHSGRLI